MTDEPPAPPSKRRPGGNEPASRPPGGDNPGNPEWRPTTDPDAPVPRALQPSRDIELLDWPVPKERLTARQRRILEVIRESIQLRGYTPSLGEIAEAVGLSSRSSVAYQLAALERKGYLRRRAGEPRDIVYGEQVSEAQEELYVHVPMLGRVAAGVPILAQESIEDYYPLPRWLVGGGDLFMLRAFGDSMIGAGIANGDQVVVRQQPDADDGEIVVALIEGEATIKILRRVEGHIWLMAQNLDYLPIPADKATIVGRVVAVLRRI
jgi:repressor LexA